jgi:hypothetical protein
MLAVIVVSLVLGVTIVFALAGYLIDRWEERAERGK